MIFAELPQAWIGAIIGSAITGSVALLIFWLNGRRESKKSRLEETRRDYESEPVFVWQGGGANLANAINVLQVRREFTNEGGAIEDLEIKAKGDIKAQIIPNGHVGEHGAGKIELDIPGVSVMPKVSFEIAYTTRRNKRSKQTFEWSEFSQRPRQIRQGQ